MVHRKFNFGPGMKEGFLACLVMVYRPSGALSKFSFQFPTACAVGCILPPLRGCGSVYFAAEQDRRFFLFPVAFAIRCPLLSACV